MAVIPGYIRDEVVVIGNHRDGMLHTFVCAFALIHFTNPRSLFSLGARYN